jgi:nitroreductase
MKNEDVLEILKKRWSPYAFSRKRIDDGKLEILFEAAGLAPSSNNEQPWLFVYVTRDNEKKFNEFLALLTESNRIWARHAWALIINLARSTYSYKGKPNMYAWYDTGMAVANLITQAAAMDIYIHQMGGFSVEKTREYFNLKDDIQPVSVMAAGHIGDGSLIPTALSERDKKRRPRKRRDLYTFKENLSGDYIKSQ